MISAIPPRHHTNSEPYAYWEGFFTPEEINQILALPAWHAKNSALIGTNNSEAGAINFDVRRTEVGWWTPCNQTTSIWNKLVDVVAEVNRQFFHFDLSGVFEPAQLGWYDAKHESHYGWHIDDIANGCPTPRKLSMVLMLSDQSEFEGGLLQIKSNDDNPISLEQVKGRAWFFPSYMLHRVTPVTKGARRSLVLWVGGPAFR